MNQWNQEKCDNYFEDIYQKEDETDEDLEYIWESVDPETFQVAEDIEEVDEWGESC